MKYLKVLEQQKVVTVSLARPEVRNAFHPEMIKEITETFQKFSKKTNARVVVLKGEGKAFCAGADLQWMQQMVNYDLAQNQKDAGELFQMMESVWNCPLPVVAAVQGAAFGGALGLIACADYVVAEEKAQFCFSEVKLGLVPAVISAFLLRKFPLGSMLPYMTSGKVFSGAQAAQIGLVQEARDEESYQDALEAIVSQYQQSGPEAVRETKTLLRKLTSLDAASAQSEVIRVISERRVSAEGQEGLKSFLEKREPGWRS